MGVSTLARIVLKAGMTAAATTFATAPIVRATMLRTGTLDIPNHRSSHTRPIPRGGGITCVCGVAAGMVVVELTEARARRRLPAVLVTAPLAMAAVGYVDDHTGGLPPMPRLVAQLCAGAVTATADLHPLAACGAVAAMPGLVNVVNFMDGIDGITGSTAVIWGVNACLVAHKDADASLAILGAVAAGAGAGFLPWNAVHARLFLGDTGSYLFGGLFAAGIVSATRDPRGRDRGPHWRAALSVAAPLFPYVADVTQAIVRRARSGQPLAEAHREHVYQQLVDETEMNHAAVTAAHALAAVTNAAASRLGPTRATGVTCAAVSSYLALPRVLAVRRARRGPAHAGVSE